MKKEYSNRNLFSLFKKYKILTLLSATKLLYSVFYFRSMDKVQSYLRYFTCEELKTLKKIILDMIQPTFPKFFSKSGNSLLRVLIKETFE